MDTEEQNRLREKARKELQTKDVIGLSNLDCTYANELDFLKDEFDVIDAGFFIQIKKKTKEPL